MSVAGTALLAAGVLTALAGIALAPAGMRGIPPAAAAGALLASCGLLCGAGLLVAVAAAGRPARPHRPKAGTAGKPTPLRHPGSGPGGWPAGGGTGGPAAAQDTQQASPAVVGVVVPRQAVPADSIPGTAPTGGYGPPGNPGEPGAYGQMDPSGQPGTGGSDAHSRYGQPGWAGAPAGTPGGQPQPAWPAPPGQQGAGPGWTPGGGQQADTAATGGFAGQGEPTRAARRSEGPGPGGGHGAPAAFGEFTAGTGTGGWPPAAVPDGRPGRGPFEPPEPASQQPDPVRETVSHTAFGPAADQGARAPFESVADQGARGQFGAAADQGARGPFEPAVSPPGRPGPPSRAAASVTSASQDHRAPQADGEPGNQETSEEWIRSLRPGGG